MEKTENCLERSLGAASYGITRQAQKMNIFSIQKQKKTSSAEARAKSNEAIGVEN